MGSRQIVLVSTAGISVLNAGIFWREAKTKRLFLQCKGLLNLIYGEIFAHFLIYQEAFPHTHMTLKPSLPYMQFMRKISFSFFYQCNISLDACALLEGSTAHYSGHKHCSWAGESFRAHLA
jgi:hypothetical protein